MPDDEIIRTVGQLVQHLDDTYGSNMPVLVEDPEGPYYYPLTVADINLVGGHPVVVLRSASNRSPVESVDDLD